jgi:excisionase family DNA binding protein
MDRPKDILTTGEVARICNVAPRTVSKWFDTGQLRGYRIPGSKDRRIPLQQLIRFMKLHGIPMDKIETGRVRVLIADGDRELTALLKQVLGEQHHYDVQLCESIFDTGTMVERFRPAVLLTDIDLPGFDARALTRFFSTHPDLHDTQLIAMSASFTDAESQTLLQQGFQSTLTKPFRLNQVIDLIDQAVNVTA